MTYVFELQEQFHNKRAKHEADEPTQNDEVHE